MNKIIQLLILSTLIQLSFQSCFCPEQQFWNDEDFVCESNPSFNEPGYVLGCKQYGYNRDNEVNCIQCEPSYFFDRYANQCIKTLLSGCDSIYTSIIPYPTNSTKEQIINYRFLAKQDPTPSSPDNETVYYYCNSCIQGYFVTQTEMACIANPQSDDDEYVQNCQNYKAEQGYIVCRSCQNSYYLQNNQCKPFPQQPSNCALFQVPQDENEVKCTVCKNGFAHLNGQCIAYSDLVPNCSQGYVLYQSNNFSCGNCVDGFYLKKTDNQQECIPNPQRGQNGYVENCKSYLQSSQGIQCGGCSGLFFINYNQKTCHPVNKPIQNCEYYNSATTCGNCGFYAELKDRQTKCMKCPYIPKNN